MPRYIDIEPIIKETKSMKFHFEAISIDGIIDRLEAEPTADVVEVVRCGDCVFCDTKHDFGLYCECWNELTNAEFFCSGGKDVLEYENTCRAGACSCRNEQQEETT